MAHVYDSNPIRIDSSSSTVDIALQAFGISNTPMFIRAVHFNNPTSGDNLVLLNHRDEVVVRMNADGGPEDLVLNVPFVSEGLKASSSGTMTTGEALIYLQ